MLQNGIRKRELDVLQDEMVWQHQLTRGLEYYKRREIGLAETMKVSGSLVEVIELPCQRMCSR